MFDPSDPAPRWKQLQENRRMREGGKGGRQARHNRFLRLLLNQRKVSPESLATKRVTKVEQPKLVTIMDIAPDIILKARMSRPKKKVDSLLQALKRENITFAPLPPPPPPLHMFDNETEEAVTLYADRMQELLKTNVGMSHVDAYRTAQKELEGKISPKIVMDIVRGQLLKIFRPEMSGAQRDY